MWKDREDGVDLICLGQDIRETNVSDEMTTDRGEWRKIHAAPRMNNNKLGQGQEEEDMMFQIRMWTRLVIPHA
jgi:hypothetical protein